MFNQKSFQRTIPLIFFLSFFMEVVDTTVINTAIPAMSRSLHVDPVDLKVALTSYLLQYLIWHCHIEFQYRTVTDTFKIHK